MVFVAGVASFFWFRRAGQISIKAQSGLCLPLRCSRGSRKAGLISTVRSRLYSRLAAYPVVFRARITARRGCVSDFAARRASLRKSIPDGVLCCSAIKRATICTTLFSSKPTFTISPDGKNRARFLFLRRSRRRIPRLRSARQSAAGILLLPQRIPSQEKWTGRQTRP